MPNCPFCEAGLHRTDLVSGACPSCSRALPNDMIATLQSDGDSTPSSPESDKGTADEDRVGETMDLTDSSVAEGKPVRPDPGKSTREAETLDFGELPSKDLDKLSVMWSQSIQPETTPRSTLRSTEARKVGTKSQLLIQQRVLREEKQGGPEIADYELLGRLGEGGMGIVLAARQASIDRSVALKVLKPAGAKEEEAREKFLSEAAVTGELEHPNIVPIYDLGKDETGTLFYSMKHVRGTPWHLVLSSKTCEENLEILMKVADAVAFAHSRRVIHRDLKPENVMLGNFGEVLLLDWGLAVSLAAGTDNIGMAGTPAYMAPELASGTVNKIGIPSDVYLLGAILYEIITDKPPHTGKNVLECLLAAAKNQIQPAKESGELMAIAMKAMGTGPDDRFASVGDLQAAIREYRSHSESVLLSARAREDLDEAKTQDSYETYARALFGFQEAYDLWDGNKQAGAGILEAGLAYAKSAFRKGDYDLASSLLDAGVAEHAELLRRIKEAHRERESRQRRLQTFKRIGAGLVLAILLGVTVTCFVIRAFYLQAEDARGKEEIQRKKAQNLQGVAEVARDDAQRAQRQEIIQREKAEDALTKEEIARKDAQAAQKREAIARKKQEYEAYVARIGLAAAKIDENAFDHADALLEECPAQFRHWEWGRLKHLCTQDVRTFDAARPLEAVAIAPDGNRLVTGGWGGEAEVWDTQSGKKLVTIPTGADYVFALAFSPDGKQIAAGTNDRPNYLKIWDARTGAPVRELPGHEDAVLSVVYSRDGKRLLTSSYDNTARLWNLESGQSKIFRGHEWWVWSAAFSPDEKRIVTASQDGSAMVWTVETAESGTPFLDHTGPVYAAAFSPDGNYVATAGYDRRVLLWNPDKVQPFDFEAPVIGQADSSAVYENLKGHTADVRSVRFSADGNWLLSGGNDNTVRVWNLGTGELHKTLRGHSGRVLACEFADNGRVLSVSHDHLAKIWSIAGYQDFRVIGGRVLEGHGNAILGASFSPDGKKIVTASRDRTAKSWDVASGKELQEFKEGHDFLISSAVFFPDGKKLITAAVDNTTRIWNVATGTQILALKGTGPTATLALSNDAKWMLSGSDDQSAKLWDAETGRVLASLKGHRSEVTAVAISPDDRLLLTGDATGQCLLWDAAARKEKRELAGHTRGITAAVFLPGGERALTASLDNTVTQWNLETGEEVSSAILKHPGAVTSMALSSDGRQVLTGCADKSVRLWDVLDGRLVASRAVAASREEEADRQREAGREDDGDNVTSVAISPDGRYALTVRSSGSVQLWKLPSLDEVTIDRPGRKAFSSSAAGDGRAWSAIFSPEGSQILTVGGSEARLWHLQTGLQSMSFSPHSSVASAHFSPDGKRVVTCSWDNTAKIWNAETGRAELKLEGEHDGFVNHAVFSPDGSKVLTASNDKTAKLWDAATGKVLLSFEGHKYGVHSALFSADGKRVLTASDDRTARIWDARTGEELGVLQGHEHAVLSAAFSADGKRAITGSADNTAKIWDVDPNHGRPRELFSLEGHTAGVTSVSFSPDGRRALTGSQDHTTKMWDARTKEQILRETFTEKEGSQWAAQGQDLVDLLAEEKMVVGKEILTLAGHSQEVTTAAFSPDSRTVLTAARDGKIILWLAVDWRPPQPAEGPQNRQ